MKKNPITPTRNWSLVCQEKLVTAVKYQKMLQEFIDKLDPEELIAEKVFSAWRRNNS